MKETLVVNVDMHFVYTLTVGMMFVDMCIHDVCLYNYVFMSWNKIADTIILNINNFSDRNNFFLDMVTMIGLCIWFDHCIGPYTVQCSL